MAQSAVDLPFGNDDGESRGLANHQQRRVNVLGIEAGDVGQPLLQACAEGGRAIGLGVVFAPVRQDGLKITRVPVIGGDGGGERERRMRVSELHPVAVSTKAGQGDFLSVGEAGGR